MYVSVSGRQGCTQSGYHVSANMYVSFPCADIGASRFGRKGILYKNMAHIAGYGNIVVCLYTLRNHNRFVRCNADIALSGFTAVGYNAVLIQDDRRVFTHIRKRYVTVDRRTDRCQNALYRNICVCNFRSNYFPFSVSVDCYTYIAVNRIVGSRGRFVFRAMHIQSDKTVLHIFKRNAAAGFQFHLILVACRLQYARFSFINPSFCFCG